MAMVEAYNTRDPQFKSSHRQNFILNTFIFNSWKDKDKEKEARIGPFVYSLIALGLLRDVFEGCNQRYFLSSLLFLPPQKVSFQPIAILLKLFSHDKVKNEAYFCKGCAEQCDQID